MAEKKRDRRDYTREYMRKYRALHPEKVRAWGRASYLRNRSAVLKRHKEYARAHPEKGREASARYRAKRRIHNPQNDRLRLIKSLGARCACCGETVWWNLTIDHIVPKSRGGKDVRSNLQVLCWGCNKSKGRHYHCQLDHSLTW